MNRLIAKALERLDKIFEQRLAVHRKRVEAVNDMALEDFKVKVHEAIEREIELLEAEDAEAVESLWPWTAENPFERFSDEQVLDLNRRRHKEGWTRDMLMPLVWGDRLEKDKNSRRWTNQWNKIQRCTGNLNVAASTHKYITAHGRPNF